MKKSILLLITCLFSMTSSLWAAEAYVVKSTDGKTLTFYYDENKASREGTVYNLTQNWRTTSITTVIFDSSFAQARPTSTESWFKYSNLKTIEGIQYLNTSKVTNMTDMFSFCSGLTSLDVSNFDTRNVTTMSGMFHSCISLTRLDLSSFDTRNVTDIGGMFSYCRSLTSLDVSNFDTRNVTTMSSMFSGCSGLTSLDVSNFDTRNVTTMNSMFSECSGLTSLDLSSFDTQNVTGMGSMFSYCRGLTSLDLSSFDTRNVTDMGGMFSYCSSLTSLDVSNLDTRNVAYMSDMFRGCRGLTSLDLSSFDTENIRSSYRFLHDCDLLSSLKISKKMRNMSESAFQGVGSSWQPCTISSLDEVDFETDTSASFFIWKGGYFTLSNETNPLPYILSYPDEHKLSFYYDYGLASRTGYYSYFTIGHEAQRSFPYCTENFDREYSDYLIFLGEYGIKTQLSPDNTLLTETIEFDMSFSEARPLSTNKWFSKMQELKSIQSIQYLKTEKVTDMNRMFSYCRGLTSLDLSSFDTQNVTDMGLMFSDCSGLTRLDLSSFDTRNVTDMGGMFSYCRILTSLDVSNFDTRNVTTMSSMFSGCSGLTSLDVSNFDTRNVITMSRMFSACSGLTSLDASNFDTRNVTDMTDMFRGCRGLTSLDVSIFDTQNVTNMSNMFSYCSSLTSLDLSNFDMSKVTSSWQMLYNCSSLKSLSISPTMENIASNACEGVGTETSPCVIYAPDGFDFGVDTFGDYFIWKGGFFTLGKLEYEGMMGDVNNDGVVSISDAVCIISWLQENSLPVFIEGAADYNKDGGITVSDALAIIQMLLTLEPDPVIPDIPDDDVSHLYPTVSAGGIDVELCNASPYTAFTMDITLSEGMTVNDISLDTRRAPRHQLVFNRLSDGRYRVIGFSPTLDSFNGNDGTLLTIKTNKKGTGRIGIDNIHFVDLNAQEYALNAAQGNTTGIDLLETGTKVYAYGSNIVVESDGEMKMDVYTATGLLYKTLDVKAGRNVFSDNAPGIYIVGNKKINIK